MRKKIILSCIFVLAVFFVFPVNYITTAKSISWNGAYTSIADGFEAMLYNPAGLYMTDARYGLNLFGSYGARIYDNSLSSDTLLTVFNKLTSGGSRDITTELHTFLSTIPDYGFNTGFDISLMNVMSYFKFKKFSLGLSMLPKTKFMLNIDKKLFSTIFDNVDLSSPINVNIISEFVQYIDLMMNLSTRAKFLERYIPVESVFVGMSGHFYLPTAYASLTTNRAKVSSYVADPVSGLMGYNVELNEDVYLSTNVGISKILQLTNVANSLGGMNFSSIFSQGGSFGFGIGFDFGFLVKFNRFVKLGFAVTDLGFIVFPATAKVRIDASADIEPNLTQMSSSMFSDFTSNFTGDMTNSLSSGATAGGVRWWMPNTTFRLGVSITPLKKDWLLIAADVSLTDVNNAILGLPPTFNVSTGIEFKPEYKWFALPIRLAISYNSQANLATASMGLGLYLGPVEMEIAIKGIEFLVLKWGAKEVNIGADFKFEF